ncbi:DUF305 domain-containing protein [Actinoplanes flavus]|uniref:DUF305 domain-containing protein n=1 Tax=Actinoplanes flavus TaxID=2820290 RepID=A0ABS3UMY8_9ACTN|nr:DUF305 domain-containing protein [Actinoplanes flavus]MBO3740134.1 DUF305 domain-containing protein [Actinoplanes flavus]
MFANPRSLASVAAALFLLTGCGDSPAPVPPAPAISAATSAAAFGGTDRSWIEITIAMDEQLLPLLDLVPGDSSLATVSAQVRAFTEAELTELRRLHAEAGLPAENPHKGMPMPGMVEPSTVASATALRGETFDALLRSCLRAHLEQSRKLAESEQAAGLEPRTTALAARISENRRTTLSAL